MIIYGIKPTLTDKNGEPFGTRKDILQKTLGRKDVFYYGMIGRNKVVYEGYREFEVKQPPIVIKRALPFRFGTGRDFMSGREVFG